MAKVKELEMPEHRPLSMLLIVGTLVVLVVTIIFTILAITDGADENLFPNGVNRADSIEYPSDIRPSSWTFRIWIFIFIFQVAWVIYAHTLLCRKNQFNNEYLYYSPPFLPRSFYAVYILSLMMTITWLFTWDNNYVSAAFVSLFATFFSLSVCLFFSFWFLWVYEANVSITEMWVNIILVQNGIGLFAVWALLASILNFSSLLVADAGVSPIDAGTICLSVLLAIYLLYVCFDVFISKKRLRYFVAPYVTLIVGLSGIVDNNWEDGQRNAEFAVAVLAFVVLGCLAKLATIIYRAIKDPLRIETMLNKM